MVTNDNVIMTTSVLFPKKLHLSNTSVVIYVLTLRDLRKWFVIDNTIMSITKPPESMCMCMHLSDKI